MNKVKPKECAVCPNMFTPRFRTTERTCCHECEAIFQKDKQAKKVDRKKPKRLAPVSQKRLRQLAEYRDKRGGFLDMKLCPVQMSGVFGLPRAVPATEVHHMDGREGDRLLDFTKCLAVSAEGHRWIHTHPAEARERGWLI